MPVSKPIEYTCEWCGQNGKSDFENHVPPDWISLAETAGGEFATLMFGTWLYCPLDFHFCSHDHAGLYMEMRKAESKADET